MIKTFEEARYLIRELQICTIFESEKSGLTSLCQKSFVVSRSSPGAVVGVLTAPLSWLFWIW